MKEALKDLTDEQFRLIKRKTYAWWIKRGVIEGRTIRTTL